MWILPKQLHTSAYVPDTEALISDLEEQSQICAQSLLVRSKPSLARTWSQKWKRDSWTQHLSGRILKPSLGQTFVTEWISCLEVIPANHLVQQASDLEKTTQDTSGLGSQMELFPCDQEFASSRTSKDTSASDSEMSSKIWRDLVMTRRGEYSQRVKSAHLTNASESLSWASITANDWKGSTPNSITRKDGKSRIDQLAYQTEQHNLYYPTPCAMEAEKAGFHAKGQMGQSLSAMANRGELQWLTPATVQIQRADMQKRIDYRASIGRQYVPGSLEEQMQQHGQAVPDSRSTSGNLQESWLTPRANEPYEKSGAVAARLKDSGSHCHGSLTAQAKYQSWATPSTMDHINVVRNPEERSSAANKGGCKNLREEVHQWATPRTGATDNSRPNNKGGIPLGDQARRAEQWATPRANKVHPEITESNRDHLANRNKSNLEKEIAGHCGKATGKLNARWVETLMGLPIGWTMPSCSSPLTIAPTNSDCSEMESCLQQQKELF